jgi:hypothetical protein
MPIPFETLLPYGIIIAVSSAERLRSPTTATDGIADVWRDGCRHEQNQEHGQRWQEAQVVG